MWLASIAQMFVLAVATPEAGGNPPPSNVPLPEPIFTRQTVFAIPFRVEQADRVEQQPVEVQLLVSVDRGTTWQLHDKTEPARRQFLFRAVADGQYWFALRTLDRSGQLRPYRIDHPGLRVVVDTALPKLQLQARRGQAGQITAQWTVEDQNPQPASLRIQYRTSADGAWQPVALSRRNIGSPGPRSTGNVTWWPQADSEEIRIRAEVLDAAGNSAVSHAQLAVAATSHPQPPGIAADTSLPQQPGTADETSTPWPAEDHPPAALAASPYSRAGAGPSADAWSAADPPPRSLAADVHPPVHNQFLSPGTQGADFTGVGPSPGQRPRMVNSRRFELEYDVSSVGPSGIARVELWGTRDGGRTWRSFALDDDNRSPLLVTVDGEGTYGFRVVVTSGAGLGGAPPQSGELPEAVIGVDLTRPHARILAAEQGTGTLVITWEASDEMLAARPVSLFFSESPAGPWTTIATGLENTGRYVWPIDNRLPRGVHLRLEVRDEAGNAAVSSTTASLLLDRLGPGVRIREVRPLDQSSATRPKRYRFR